MFHEKNTKYNKISDISVLKSVLHKIETVLISVQFTRVDL